jgi:hypothetical protein
MTAVASSRAPLLSRDELRPLAPLYGAYAVSQSGSWLFKAAALYHVYAGQHGSMPALASGVVLSYVPIIFGARYLAALADRVSSRSLLVGLDLGRAVLLMPLLWLGDATSSAAVALTLTAITLLSLASPLFAAGQAACLRRAVSSGALSHALSTLSAIEWMTFTLGTAVGTTIVLSRGMLPVVGADIASFFISALVLAKCLRVGAVPTAAAATNTGPDHANPKPALRCEMTYVLVAVFVLNFGAGVINLYPNVVAHEFLRGHRSALSLIYCANGVGGLVGALYAARRVSRWSSARLMQVASGLIAASLLAMTQVRVEAIALLASSAMLCFGQIFAVGAQTRMLQVSPTSLAGRASGRFLSATFGGVACNAMVAAALTPTAQESFVPFVFVCAAAAAATCLPAMLSGRATPGRSPRGLRRAVTRSRYAGSACEQRTDRP